MSCSNVTLITKNQAHDKNADGIFVVSLNMGGGEGVIRIMNHERSA